jgi:hypothetical protein
MVLNKMRLNKEYGGLDMDREFLAHDSELMVMELLMLRVAQSESPEEAGAYMDVYSELCSLIMERTAYADGMEEIYE